MCTSGCQTHWSSNNIIDELIVLVLQVALTRPHQRRHDGTDSVMRGVVKTSNSCVWTTVTGGQDDTDEIPKSMHVTAPWKYERGVKACKICWTPISNKGAGVMETFLILLPFQVSSSSSFGDITELS